ncbi:hypothetical protein WME76_02235 [Sorangium sp. So ce119]|uniref:hypothetical protein n=1 Tax=Sorangium sp. So ce119 TaxID=3133279 RepID=UPI003F642B32
MGSAAAGTWLDDLETRVVQRRAARVRRTWPCAEYQRAPVRFCEEQLGFEPWDRQAEVLEALVPPGAWVSVVSGHKIGKSSLAAGAAHWFSSSFEEARVVLLAPKAEHIRVVIWREVTKFYKRSGRCSSCRAIEARENRTPDPCPFCSPLGDPEWLSVEPHRGLRYPDGREIFGYTARDVDAIGGLSGPNMLFIYDEASGIPDGVFNAMKGNAAGGVRVLMIGNPLRTTGEFYESRHNPAKKKLYTTFQISSEDTPNARTGRAVIPGLATRKWCEERAEEWGRDSVLYAVRVRGEDPKYEEGQLVPVDVIEDAEKRWETARAEGRLQIGVDVAFTGDDAAIAPRRGQKILEVTSISDAGDEETLAEHVMSAVRAHRRDHERKPLVVYDSNGPGARLGKALRAYADEIEIVGVNGTATPRSPKEFFQLRDEVACNFAAWLKAGGAIPSDGKLQGEIGHTKAIDAGGGRRRVWSNDAIKRVLGRSPDRRNACELAVWEVASGASAEDEQLVAQPTLPQVRTYGGRGAEGRPAPATGLNPYAGGIDPYGGRGRRS